MGKLIMQKFGSFFLTLLLAGMVGVLTGCSGDDGAPGPAGLSAYELAVQNGTFTGTEEEFVLMQAGVKPESCATCHDGNVVRSGDTHQDAYDELFQIGAVVIDPTTVAYTNDGVNDVVTFDMAEDKDGDGVYDPFDCTTADSISILFTTYIGMQRFEQDGRLSIGGTLTYDGAGGCTSTNPQSVNGNLNLINGLIVIEGRDETEVTVQELHLNLARYPFAAVLQTGAGVDYASAANVTGCENCHTTPYFKHGFIQGTVDADGDGMLDPATDFYTCKACHIDNDPGSHEEWQIKVDNPMRWAEIFNGDPITPEEEIQYFYTRRLMNDVHMSHSMEFPFPQSIANCATCHAGKLDQTLADANMVIETCKSCHPVTGGTDFPDANGDFAVDTRPLALENIIPHSWTDATVCSLCHSTGASGIAPPFSDIHPGYDPVIYADTAGNKYLASISASVDAVSFDAATNMLTINASAAGSAGGLNATGIVPTVLVGLYGWDTKDFLVNPHDRDANRDRLLEWQLGSDPNPRVSGMEVAPGAGQDIAWQFTADLTMWADLMADGSIRRAEVAILPTLASADVGNVALVAPSMTFDLNANAFEPDYYQGEDAIVNVDRTADNNGVERGCNTCHDVLGSTFHSVRRVGNIVVCRMCHTTRNAGSHIEGQSRSIDSYTHAVHSFQAFDVDEIDFDDPVEAAIYEEHTSFLFPDFATINCQACHVDRDTVLRTVYNVPNQARSMPGAISATQDVPGRNIGVIPELVTGPASRACGACHRAQKINADDAGDLASFIQHTRDFGYAVENDQDDNILDAIIFFIMDIFY